jgi:mono/diheme cytochrome c family protein
MKVFLHPLGTMLLVFGAGLSVLVSAGALQLAQPEVPLTGEAARLKAEGEVLYGKGCIGCHGAQGQGGVGAPLGNNPLLQDTGYVVQSLLKGVGYMHAVGGRLTDRELAAVITFVRTSFGNTYGAVDEAEVVKLK